MYHKKKFAPYYAFLSPLENLIYFCASADLLEARELGKRVESASSIAYIIPHKDVEHRKFFFECPLPPEDKVKLGKWGEAIVADLIRKKWPECLVIEVPTNTPPQYEDDLDIIAHCPDKTWCIQVKTDMGIARTGNLYFEIAEANLQKIWE